eukprot:6614229-Prorocentrum_lima.AAC.1
MKRAREFIGPKFSPPEWSYRMDYKETRHNMGGRAAEPAQLNEASSSSQEPMRERDHTRPGATIP